MQRRQGKTGGQMVTARNEQHVQYHGKVDKDMH
jgi:hypothetical protein